MSGDKSKFMSLSKNKSGNVTFGNDARRKIKGKGIVKLSNYNYNFYCVVDKY